MLYAALYSQAFEFIVKVRSLPLVLILILASYFSYLPLAWLRSCLYRLLSLPNNAPSPLAQPSA